jgi:hypothetical protein
LLSTSTRSRTPHLQSQLTSDDESESSNKTRKRRRNNKGDKVDLGIAISNMATELRLTRELKQEPIKTLQEKAIELLYKEYQDRLTDIDFVEAITLLESESKARIFVALRGGDIRDKWLEKNTLIELLPKESK